VTTISDWRSARVVSNEPACEDMISLLLEPEELLPHRAGQHYELRLPGDGLSRKYSIVSPPERDSPLEFGVQLLPTGLVSPRLAATRPGDRVEIRGPLGEAFVWTPASGRSLILLGGGAGITPLLSIYEHFRRSVPRGREIFIMSAKTPQRIYRYERYRDRLTTRFTSSDPRLDKDDLVAITGDLLHDSEASAWICGPPGFIDLMVDNLIELDFPEMRIRSEAFV